MERLSTLKPPDGTAPVQRERLGLWEGGKGQDEQGGAPTQQACIRGALRQTREHPSGAGRKMVPFPGSVRHRKTDGHRHSSTQIGP